MADPVFLARLLAASAMAVILALCAANARGGNAPAQAATSIVSDD
jgi:hypothetical protein